MSLWITKMLGGRPSGGSGGRAALIKRYDAYLQVLRANADVLELLSELEAMALAPGSSGRQHGKAVVTRIGVQVYAMAKMLRLLGGPQYDAIFPAIDRIRASLEAALGEPSGARAPGTWVVWTDDEAASDTDAVGGKAANLGRMRAADVPGVIDGFAVGVEAFRAVLWHNRLDETVRVLSAALDPDEPAHLLETSARLQQAMRAAELPADLDQAIRDAATRLAARRDAPMALAVRSSATGEDGGLSFAGQYTTVLDVPVHDIVSAYRQVLAGFFNPRAVLMRLRRGFGPLELGMGALVTPMVTARASGVAYSREPLQSESDHAVVEAVAGRAEALVGGAADPVTWRIDRASLRVGAASGRASLANLLTEAQAAEIARLALRAEEVLGCAADIEWAFGTDSRLILLQARPLAVLPAPAQERRPPISGYAVLVQGGVCASPGVGVGCAVWIRGREEALLLPKGSVLVAVEASPDLALALPRAAAVVADRGSVTGHLAATAREFGVPALFGVGSAAAAIEEGALLTVDATSGRVYAGAVAELDRWPASEPAHVDVPASSMLTKVLPLVLPLTLTDPRSAEFNPEACRTIHDLVRYMHEKALVETVGTSDGSDGAWYRVAEPLPFDLRLVPLEGGVAALPHARTVTRDQVTSLPASAVLEGLLDPAVKRTGPTPIDAAGFLSVLSQSALETGLGGPTWGIVSDRYLQLSSRIGYHFTTIEAMVGERDQESRIRFVFRGGAADEPRRSRRARFIARVLEGLGFQVTLKGDYVSGTFGHAPAASVCGSLRALGRLLVCANRLDMLLADGALADWYADRFLAGDYGPLLRGERPDRIDSLRHE